MLTHQFGILAVTQQRWRLDSDPLLADEMWNLLRAENLPTNMFLDSPTNSVSVLDMYTLGPGNMVNDEVINAYFEKISARHRSGSSDVKFLFHNTFFMVHLQKLESLHGISLRNKIIEINRWCIKCGDDVFGAAMTFIPINHKEMFQTPHWNLAVIDMRGLVKQVLVLDSINKPADMVMSVIQRYLTLEYERLPEDRQEMANISFDDENRWSFNDTRSLLRAGVNVPRQVNSLDCGVFTAMYADYMSQQKPMTFSQSDMRQLRYKMAISLMTAGILSDAGQAPFITRNLEVVQ
jgi:sentrin-specific protease 1